MGATSALRLGFLPEQEKPVGMYVVPHPPLLPLLLIAPVLELLELGMPLELLAAIMPLELLAPVGDVPPVPPVPVPPPPLQPKIHEHEGLERKIGARTIVWAAGVALSFAEVLERRAGAARDRIGRVVVNPDCSVPGHPGIFVIGDLAHFEQDENRFRAYRRWPSSRALMWRNSFADGRGTKNLFRPSTISTKATWR